MNRYVVLAALSAAALVAACGSGDTSQLGNGTGASGTPGGDTSGGNNSTSGDPTSGDPSNAGTPPSTPSAPPPAAGPGSTGSLGHAYFVANVYPSIETTCGTCHNTGVDGSPKFLVASDATTSYQNLDARGDVIVAPDSSVILHHGAHDSGKAPEPTAAQITTITNWLNQEMQDRAGQAAPVNVLSKMGTCLDQTKFDAIGFQTLVTTKRTTENANNCTGCNNAPCRTCHTGGDGGFYMAVGSSLDSTTFAETQTPTYIVKYLGLNGATPVASNAIATKSAATKTGAPYTHPMFTIPTTMQTALDAFVADAITKYAAGTCGK
jgi:hypothetical protein